MARKSKSVVESDTAVATLEVVPTLPVPATPVKFGRGRPSKDSLAQRTAARLAALAAEQRDLEMQATLAAHPAVADAYRARHNARNAVRRSQDMLDSLDKMGEDDRERITSDAKDTIASAEARIAEIQRGLAVARLIESGDYQGAFTLQRNQRIALLDKATATLADEAGKAHIVVE